ncbi:MAG: pyruvate kinase [Gammaproteobacteria bacterium]
MPIDIEFTRLRFRRTKIVATVGPACSTPETINELIVAGVNVFRLNMSHGNHQSHSTVFNIIRQASREKNAHVAILADLCGPKIRCGKFENGQIELVAGESVTVTTEPITGRPGVIPSAYENLHLDAAEHSRLLLDDGKLELLVEQINGKELKCKVIQGGVLKDRKGINLPLRDVSAPALTEQDYADARLMLGLGVDFLALSFTRKKADVDLLRKVVEEFDPPAAIIAKLENHEGLKNADEIIAAADGIMVARGDMGVELRPEEVPVAQDQLVLAARNQGKPVIVATQMLESMINTLQPTRAEVSDISHAVQSGTDAIMLSGETAAGAYPVKAVEMMDRIARHNEGYQWQIEASDEFKSTTAIPPIPLHYAIANALSSLSHDLQVYCIIVISRGGTSALTVSSARPSSPIIAASSLAETCRRMNLNWGTIPVETDTDSFELNPRLASELAHTSFGATRGDRVLLLKGFNANPQLHAPSITTLFV